MSAASDAADVASLLPIQDPVAQLARQRLEVAVREQREHRMHKITAANGVAVQHIGDPSLPAVCWLIDGVGYSDNPGVIAYAERTDGAAAEPTDDVPAEYLAHVARIRGASVVRIGSPASDGATL